MLHFVQVEREFIEGAEPDNVAEKLKVTPDEVIGKAVRMWNWSQEHAKPDGIVRGAGAVSAIERAACWTGKRGAWVAAMVEAQVLAVVPEGVVFRGWVERYGAALENAEARSEKARRAAETRWSNARSNARSIPNASDSMLGACPEQCSGDAKTEDFRPKTLEPEILKPPPTPSAAAAEPPAVVVEEFISVRGVDGIPTRKRIHVVRWQPTPDGCWEFVQLSRELAGLLREAKRPRGFVEWSARALNEAGPDAIEQTYRGFLEDGEIRAVGHPTSVFIGRNGEGGIWEARKPGRGAA